MNVLFILRGAISPTPPAIRSDLTPYGLHFPDAGARELTHQNMRYACVSCAETHSEQWVRRGAKLTDGLVIAKVADDPPAILSLHEPMHFFLPAIDRNALFRLS